MCRTARAQLATLLHGRLIVAVSYHRFQPDENAITEADKWKLAGASGRVYDASFHAKPLGRLAYREITFGCGSPSAGLQGCDFRTHFLYRPACAIGDFPVGTVRLQVEEKPRTFAFFGRVFAIAFNHAGSVAYGWHGSQGEYRRGKNMTTRPVFGTPYRRESGLTETRRRG